MKKLLLIIILFINVHVYAEEEEKKRYYCERNVKAIGLSYVFDSDTKCSRLGQNIKEIAKEEFLAKKDKQDKEDEANKEAHDMLNDPNFAFKGKEIRDKAAIFCDVTKICTEETYANHYDSYLEAKQHKAIALVRKLGSANEYFLTHYGEHTGANSKKIAYTKALEQCEDKKNDFKDLQDFENYECKIIIYNNDFISGDYLHWANNLFEAAEKEAQQAEKEAQQYNEPTLHLHRTVSFDDEDFVLRQDQKSLTYINSKDDIPGRFLYDQEDVTDDYQVHIIYLLAKDSKDKKLDVKSRIAKIVLRTNKMMKKKTKDKKQFRLDMTKEGKVDVSFLRVGRTKKEIERMHGAASYFTAQIVKNGFYHPKKTYGIFYQDRYFDQKWQEGQLGDVLFNTPNGSLDIFTAVTYLQDSSTDAPFIHLHEMFHSLGFIQGCAPGRSDERGITHLKYSDDVMSDSDSGQQRIDKKSRDYYSHSNSDCPMDVSKSVFLEPTEKDAQLKPRAPNRSACRISANQKIYKHERALACLTRLDF